MGSKVFVPGSGFVLKKELPTHIRKENFLKERGKAISKIKQCRKRSITEVRK